MKKSLLLKITSVTSQDSSACICTGIKQPPTVRPAVREEVKIRQDIGSSPEAKQELGRGRGARR